MILARLNPDVADRSCEDCQRFKYDDDQRVGGVMLRHDDDTPYEREPGEKPPCNRCPKIPPNAPPFPHYAVELSPKNRRAIFFHERCRAVGAWPPDPIVLQNAGLIESVERMVRDNRERKSAAMLESFLSLAMIARGRNA